MLQDFQTWFHFLHRATDNTYGIISLVSNMTTSKGQNIIKQLKSSNFCSIMFKNFNISASKWHWKQHIRRMLIQEDPFEFSLISSMVEKRTCYCQHEHTIRGCTQVIINNVQKNIVNIYANHSVALIQHINTHRQSLLLCQIINKKNKKHIFIVVKSLLNTCRIQGIKVIYTEGSRMGSRSEAQDIPLSYPAWNLM